MAVQNQIAKNLSIGYWNAQGLISKSGKFNDFKHFVIQNDLDIVTVCETKIGKRKTPNIKGYKKLYNPSQQPSAYGILIYYKNRLNITDTFIADITTHNLCIEVNNIITIVSIYAPKDELKKQELIDLSNINQQVLIIGDLNAKHKDWHNTIPNENGHELKKALNESNLILYAPSRPTCYANPNNPSTIDLILTKNIQVANIKTHLNLPSDHRPVTFITPRLQYPKVPPVERFDYSKANWAGFKNHITTNFVLNRNIQTVANVNETIASLTNIINEAAINNIPLFPINTNNALPLIITDAIKNRNRLRKKYQKTPTAQNKEALYNAQNLVQDLLVEYDNEAWTRKINKAIEDRGQVWKEIRAAKSGGAFTVAPLVTDEQNPHIKTITDTDKANTLAKHFENQHKLTTNLSDIETNQEVEQALRTIENEWQNQPNEMHTTLTQIIKIIKSSRPYKSAGKDKIQNKVLKYLPRKAIVQIYYVLNACFRLCYFPECWKHAIIIPMLKKNNNPNLPASYRPISLLPALGKIFEKIINIELQYHMFENNFLIPEQFGFRRKHTTTLQVARLVNKAKLNENMNHTTSAAFLDMEKAFDVVWIDGLIYKMKNSNFPYPLVKLTQSYLSNRTFQIRISNQFSDTKQIVAGVPQGGALSATLFLIFINDIPKNSGTQLAMFADDTAIIASSRRAWLANSKISKHLEQLEQYCNKWKLRINPDKSQLINFSNKRYQEKFQVAKINDISIPTINTATYLGVKLDYKLKFTDHIKFIKSKGYAAYKYIFPYIKYDSPLTTKLKIQLYKAYVRPILTYAAPVFISAADSALNELQVLENKCLRTIVNCKPYEICNRDLYAQCEVTPYMHLIYKHSLKFFGEEVNNSELTQGMGEVNASILPFRVKHKLIHQRLLDCDPTA